MRYVVLHISLAKLAHSLILGSCICLLKCRRYGLHIAPSVFLGKMQIYDGVGRPAVTTTDDGFRISAPSWRPCHICRRPASPLLFANLRTVLQNELQLRHRRQTWWLDDRITRARSGKVSRYFLFRYFVTLHHPASVEEEICVHLRLLVLTYE